LSAEKRLPEGLRTSLSGVIPVEVEDPIEEGDVQYYSYQKLKLRPYNLDSSKFEIYLRDDEFQQIFQCNKAEFALLPGWKQRQMKVSAGLF